MLPANFGQITIRYLENDDLDSYITLEKDPDIKRYMGGPNNKPNEQMRNNLLSYTPTHSLMAIAGSSTNQYLGRCGYLDTDQPQEKELYILLGHESQKKGYGQLIIPFLCDLAISEGYSPVAYIDPENIGSLKLLEKLGWVTTGKITKNNYQEDHLIYVPSK